LVDETVQPFRFLDIACGDARATVETLKGTRVANYYGIDLSSAALNLARKALESLGCPLTLDGPNEPCSEVQTEESQEASISEDSDDVVDPDDSVLPALPAPSEMPSIFWTPLLFGRPSDAVSPEDVRLALALIEARLAEGSW